jgi:hypothetical protein
MRSFFFFSNGLNDAYGICNNQLQAALGSCFCGENGEMQAVPLVIWISPMSNPLNKPPQGVQNTSLSISNGSYLVISDI